MWRKPGLTPAVLFAPATIMRASPRQPSGQRQQLSNALLTDSLRVFPVAPARITNVEGPVIKVQRVSL
jgi:hypothetical protein